jgi:hypothetical protein
MAGAYMTPVILKRYNSKWPEEKIFFFLDLFLTKCIRMISCSRFVQKNLVLAIFQSKYSSFHLFVVVFLCIPASWESYINPRRPKEAANGGGLSHGVLPAPRGRLGVIDDSQQHGNALFLAIKIRVK